MYSEWIEGSTPFDYAYFDRPKKRCPNGHLMPVSVGWYGAKYECLKCPDQAF